MRQKVLERLGHFWAAEDGVSRKPLLSAPIIPNCTEDGFFADILFDAYRIQWRSGQLNWFQGKGLSIFSFNGLLLIGINT